MTTRLVVIGDGARPWSPPSGWNVELVAPVYAVPPPEYDAPESNWGCGLAHQREWQRAAADGIESLTVFEDDAIFVDDFNEKYDELMDQEFDVLMLGGQNVYPPKPINDVVSESVHTIRTHAYVLRRPAIEMLAGDIKPPWRSFDWDWHSKWLTGMKIVEPKKWLAGQAPDNWWQR